MDPEIGPELGLEFIEQSGGNRHQDEGGRVCNAECKAQRRER